MDTSSAPPIPASSSSSSSSRLVVMSTTTVVALMLSYGITPAQCFQSVNGLSSIAEPARPATTRRFFRNNAETTTNNAFSTDSLLSVQSQLEAAYSASSSGSAAADATGQHHQTYDEYVAAQQHLQQQQQIEAAYYNNGAYQQQHPQHPTSTTYEEAAAAYASFSAYDTYSQPEGWNDPAIKQHQQQQQQQYQHVHYEQQQQQQHQPQQQQQPNDLSYLPTWLADPKDELWESTWYQLEEAMLASFFTPYETQKLLSTIETASRGDRHQMTSAAEFCLILVETMEMGLTALMAASYHVCACVTARQHQQESSSPSYISTSFYDHEALDDNRSGGTISVENHHVALIAKDAGRLKTLEMVAAMIYGDKASSRVTPDTQDAENLRSLLLTETKDWRALAIRSAASLYRLKGILRHAQQVHYASYGSGAGAADSFNMRQHVTSEALVCAREALYIYAPLASRLGMHRLKNELEGSAFQILYRRQYEKVNRLARELRPRHSKPHLNRGLVEMCDHTLDISSCMKNVLETVKADMTQLLSQDQHFAQYVQDFSVTARVKEPYSLWKKMLRNKSKTIRDVPDAIALRIVLEAKPLEQFEDEDVKRARERALCYYAQKLCMEHWHPVADNPRFKDYIDSPKPNGYQSLHYTAHTMWDGEDWNLEIQVRSQEMHQVAEFGLASHWDYKQQQTLNNKAAPQDHHVDASTVAAAGSVDTTYATAAAAAAAAAATTTSPEMAYHGITNDQSSDAYLRSVQEWYWQQQGSAAATAAAAAAAAEQQQWTTADTSATGTTESEERADRIRARTKKLQPYIDAIKEAQSDLARDHVFVFLTTCENANGGPGSVLALPAGACVLDALREGEKEWGFPFPEQVRLNGELLDKVTGKLQNGDILTVPVTCATTMA